MKFLNFRFDHGRLEVAGQSFDLHNHTPLQGYAYDTRARVFTLDLRGQVFYGSTPVTTAAAIDVRFTFRNVRRLLINELAIDPDNVCWNGMDPASEGMSSLAQVLERMGEEGQAPDPPFDWDNARCISFTWGVEILISAETAEVSVRQSAGPEGSAG